MESTVADPRRVKMAELARMADRVSVLVLSDCYPEIDVIVAVENLREEAMLMFPGTRQLFDMVYLSRFRRLWDQFRCSGRAPF